MLFTIAQSAAPTRAASPDGNEPEDGESAERRARDPMPMRSALSSRRRVEFLKNYVGQVAPWVSGSTRESVDDDYGGETTRRVGFRLNWKGPVDSCIVIR